MLKIQKNTRLYRVASLEQLQNILSSNYGSAFQIYVTSSINISGVVIPAWTLFNVQMPRENDVFEAVGVNVMTGETYILYGQNLENIRVT